ncbi:CotH kinase family protein [Rhodohalobacter sp. 614A]|uniref:CotH kinase family protein n=1 Tax=Rhodohalobacter sp. 614A TaxID=2908649 RepID=UPI00351CDA85
MKFMNLLTLAGLRFLLFAFLFVYSPTAVFGQDLYLNEVMSSNDSIISDEDGDFQDWVEIYNAGSDTIQLAGFGLSDDEDEPFKWTFPDTIIQPKNFMLIWASNKERNTAGGELHTNFAISASGETVILTHPDGTQVDQLSPTEIPSDVSIGRQPDGTGDWVFFDMPTPGISNDTESTGGQLEPPQLSHTPGFYTSPFELEISHPQENVTIYYTLDGSTPDENSAIYSGPISIINRSNEANNISTIRTNHVSGWLQSQDPAGNILKGTVLRIKAVKDGYLPVFSGSTYFVFDDGSATHNLPVISLATDNRNLFSDETGIYVPGNRYADGRDDTGNYYMHGDAWEREASMEFFEPDGHRGFSQNVGLRIHGGWTRRLPQKSLRVYARSEYGESRINYPVFPDQDYETYDRLILRNSGNDFGITMIRDAAAHLTVKHFNMDTQAYRPAAVYINGEYWGIHNIRERFDAHYLERVYGIDPDNIDYLSGRWTEEEGSNQEYAALLHFVENKDLSLSQNMGHVRRKIDLDNFMDYYTAEVYFANVDWPQNNMEFWRLRVPFKEDAPPGHDGRWRWMFYDLDQSFAYDVGTDGAIPKASFDMIEWILAEKNPENNQTWPGMIFRRLAQNPNFKDNFINRIADHLNTSFQAERMTAIVDSIKTLIEPEMENHMERWIYPKGYNAWTKNLDELYTFIQQRPEYLREHIMNHFGIDSTSTITVDSSHPYQTDVHVNSLHISPDTPGILPDPFPWTGTYFSGVPVLLNVETGQELVFKYWQVNHTKVYTPNIEVLPDTVDTATAVFSERDFTEITPHILADGEYRFSEWSDQEPAGTYPNSMAFVYMDEADPGLGASVDGFTFGEYDLDSRTRINGFGEDGFSFINTGNEDGNPGYPGTRLGGAILVLNTEGQDSVNVEWSAGTMEPNSRIYNLRLQYRTDPDEAFRDVLDDAGDPVEYSRNEVAGHSEAVNPVFLPPDAEKQPRVELLWRYYYIGQRVDEESGQRSMLNISEIRVTSQLFTEEPDPEPEPDPVPEKFYLYQNYPNPFYPETRIRYDLPQNQHVQIDLFSIDGRHIAKLEDRPAEAGYHYIDIDLGSLASGIYLYRLVTDDFSDVKKMSVVK